MYSYQRFRSAIFVVGLAVCASGAGCLANINSGSDGSGGQAAGEGVGGNNPAGSGDPTGVDPNDPMPAAPIYPFEAVTPEVSLRKMKTLILGTAATDDELAAASDDGKVAALVDGWLQTPASDQALLDFFMWSFQLSQMTPLQAFTQQKQNHPPLEIDARAIRESMGRTALYMVRDGQPFSNIATTTKFMVTPNFLSWLIIVDNQGSKEYETMLNPNFHFTLVDNANIPLDRSGNPSDPDYMIWTAPPMTTTCPTTLNHSFTVDKNTYNGQVDFALWLHLGGRSYSNVQIKGGGYCEVDYANNKNRMPANQLYNWRLVNLRRTKPGERSTPFWDFNTLLNANEIVLRIPRVGYYTTPAFYAQAPSNVNNQSRVTINQAMIVGLHQVFDGVDQTPPANTAALVPEHAQPGTACFGCHITMDPMRQFFRQAMTEDAHVQEDANLKNMPGVWAWDGVSDVDPDIADFGQHIIKSPRFPMAWVQKVCTWVNSVPCDEDDPELIAIADAFKDSQFNFLKMFQAVLTSKVTTYRAVSQTAESRNTIFSMARRTQICTVLSVRLNYPDICGRLANTVLPTNLSQAAALLVQYPTDGYFRGATLPNMAISPSVPVRTSLESACGYISNEFIDAGSNTKWRSSAPASAFSDWATQLMGIPTASAQPVIDLLANHFADASKAGLSASNALRSTFVVACLSPYVTNIGVF